MREEDGEGSMLELMLAWMVLTQVVCTLVVVCSTLSSDWSAASHEE